MKLSDPMLNIRDDYEKAERKKSQIVMMAEAPAECNEYVENAHAGRWLPFEVSFNPTVD